MNYHLSLLPVIAALLLSCCAERQLDADQAADYARYKQWHGTVAAKLRYAAIQATKIEGHFKEVKTQKVIRVPMSAKEQAVVRRLFAGVESPPLLPPDDWYEYELYQRNMIHPSPPAAFCDIVFLAADGTELASWSLFESPWTDIGDKKNADSYREFEDGSDMGDKLFGRYIPNPLADAELIRQFEELPVMTKLSKLLQEAYSPRK